MSKPKGSLKMSSPVQDYDHKGGPVSPKKSPKLSGKGSGKGTKVHLVMDSPDYSGGGWTVGRK
jgi:hypothetical protein